MTREEHLLVHVAEECLEVSEQCLKLAKIATKSLRFGLEDHPPGNVSTNRELLLNEFNDLFAVFTSLFPRFELLNQNKIDAKKEKMGVWMDYAYKQGTLISDDNQPAFLPLPTVDEETANTPKLSYAEQVFLNGNIYRYYYSVSSLKRLVEGATIDQRVTRFNGKIFTEMILKDLPVILPIDAIYIGEGHFQEVQFNGRWSDLPETV